MTKKIITGWTNPLSWNGHKYHIKSDHNPQDFTATKRLEKKKRENEKHETLDLSTRYNV